MTHVCACLTYSILIVTQTFVDLYEQPVAAYLDCFNFKSPLLKSMYAVTDGFSGLNGSWQTPGTGMNFLMHNMVSCLSYASTSWLPACHKPWSLACRTFLDCLHNFYSVITIMVGTYRVCSMCESSQVLFWSACFLHNTRSYHQHPRDVLTGLIWFALQNAMQDLKCHCLTDIE